MAAMALLLAAGSGERLGAGAPKAFLLLRGRPMLERSLVAIACTPSIDSVVLVVPDDRRAEAARIAAGVQPVLTVEAIVVGGATRQESVRRGLDAVPDRTDVVVCHDAARPLASQELFARVIAAVAPAGRAHGAVPVVPSADTVKRIRYGAVAETLPRDEIGLAQTPQAFVAAALRDAHVRAVAAGLGATDDATLLERAGYRVVAVEGEPSNFKITTAEDLRRAELHLEQPSPEARTRDE